MIKQLALIRKTVGMKVEKDDPFYNLTNENKISA